MYLHEIILDLSFEDFTEEYSETLEFYLAPVN